MYLKIQILSWVKSKVRWHRANLKFHNHNLFSKRFLWLINWSNRMTHKTSWHHLIQVRSLPMTSSMRVLSTITILSRHKTLMTSTISTLRKMMMRSAYKLRKMFSIITLNAWSKKPIWSLWKEKLSQSLRMQCSTMRIMTWKVICNQLKKSRKRSSLCTQSFWKKSNHLRLSSETNSRSDTKDNWQC